MVRGIEEIEDMRGMDGQREWEKWNDLNFKAQLHTTKVVKIAIRIVINKNDTGSFRIEF